MKKNVFGILLVLVLVVLAGVGLVVFRKAKPPVVVSRTDPPKIRFEETSHDLGTVMEGVEVAYTFKIHNMGGEPLLIQDVSTSCGCTVLNLKDKVIAPGKVGELEVVMDTAMKQGFVRKTVDVLSNDPKRAKTQVFLSANILRSPTRPMTIAGTGGGSSETTPAPSGTPADPHAGLTSTGKAKIFTGRCMACHVNAGKGKRGKELYQADCAMCHGAHAQGAVGPALVPGNYGDPVYVEHLLQVIRHGSSKSVSMPGFLKEAGGPLTDDEILSIVEYLRTASEEAQPVPSVPPGG